MSTKTQKKRGRPSTIKPAQKESQTAVELDLFEIEDDIPIPVSGYDKDRSFERKITASLHNLTKVGQSFLVPRSLFSFKVEDETRRGTSARNKIQSFVKPLTEELNKIHMNQPGATPVSFLLHVEKDANKKLIGIRVFKRS